MPDKTRLNPPGYVYFDNSGNPLASGKVHTYIEGTTTNKTTYTDQAGGTANANPVILDSNGRADIWLDVDEGYKIIVKDSNDNTISTVDNVFGILNDDIQFSDAKGIFDENGNEQLIFQTTASAVNYLEITNAATGNGPTLNVQGSDSNAPFTISSLGSGAITLSSSSGTANLTATSGAVNITAGSSSAVNITSGTGGLVFTGGFLSLGNGATGQGELRLLEDSDNGTNYIAFKPPAAITSTVTFTLPDGDGSADQTLKTDGAGNLSWTSSGTAASQAEMETATDTTKFVSPGRSHFHPGVAKVWANIDGEGTVAVTSDYGISGIVDNGTGDYTINFDTNFSSATYAVITGQEEFATGSSDSLTTFSLKSGGQSVSSVQLFSKRFAGSNSQDIDADPCFVACFGDL